MNVHQKYKTINHHHLDFSYRAANGQFEYPNSALSLVECLDGQWFIEQEFGSEYSQFPGLLKSSDDVTTEPNFYPDGVSAAIAACVLIKQIYPTTDEKLLVECLKG